MMKRIAIIAAVGIFAVAAFTGVAVSQSVRIL
jgi:hypothetical protein